MRRLHPGLTIALAAAALAGGNLPSGQNVRVISGADAGQLVKGAPNAGGLFNASPVEGVFGGGRLYGWTHPTYRNRLPVSVAQGKRNARKRRNVLRARGHHRKAVR